MNNDKKCATCGELESFHNLQYVAEQCALIKIRSASPDSICGICGARFGYHKAGNNACPVNNGHAESFSSHFVFRLSSTPVKPITSLDDTCVVCGQRRGLHRRLGNYCPLLNAGSPFHETNVFSTLCTEGMSDDTVAVERAISKYRKSNVDGGNLYLGKSTFSRMVKDPSNVSKWGYDQGSVPRRTYKGMRVYTVNASNHIAVCV